MHLDTTTYSFDGFKTNSPIFIAIWGNSLWFSSSVLVSDGEFIHFINDNRTPLHKI